MDWGLVDFNLSLLPAARYVLAGVDPYTADLVFFSPPWVLYPVLLLAPLPDLMATLLWLLMLLGAIVASLHLAKGILAPSIKGKPLWLLSMLILTPYSLQTLFSGQYTPFVMLGMVGVFAWDNPLPSLLLLSFKPQLGALSTVILMGTLARAGEWRRLLGSMALVGAIIGASFLIVPHSFSGFSAAILAGRSIAHHTHWITSLPRALAQIGLDEAYVWPVYLVVAIALVGLLVARRDLAMVVTCSLLIAPYAREYDYVLLTIPALYLLQRGIARPLVWLSLLWPLHRFIVGDLSWSWLSIFVPLIFLVLLLYEKRGSATSSS